MITMHKNNRSFHTKLRREEGVASILSVIFFIIIISVITLGFMRMASLESQQTLEDSLSKSALAAAYSGITDGKRALLYCTKNPFASGCDDNDPSQIFNPSCRGFFDHQPLRNALGIPDPDADPLTRGGVPIGDPAANERYTCVLVANDTWDVSGTLTLDTNKNTDVIPLRGTQPFTQVRISWKQSGPGVNLGGLNYNGLPTQFNYRKPNAYGTGVSQWRSHWAAVLRTSLFSHPPSGVVYQADGTVDISETTSFLYPEHRSNSGPSDTVARGAMIPRQLVNCKNGPNGFSINSNSLLGNYACQLTITGLDPLTSVYYLQLTNMYTDADFVVELLDGFDNPVKFDNVSPQIDSTGAVEDVFRRVQVRLRCVGEDCGGSNPILPNALDVGSGICKNFSVSTTAAQFNDTNCGF